MTGNAGSLESGGIRSAPPVVGHARMACGSVVRRALGRGGGSWLWFALVHAALGPVSVASHCPLVWFRVTDRPRPRGGGWGGCIDSLVGRLGTGWSVTLSAGQSSRTFDGQRRRCRRCVTFWSFCVWGPVASLTRPGQGVLDAANGRKEADRFVRNEVAGAKKRRFLRNESREAQPSLRRLPE